MNEINVASIRESASSLLDSDQLSSRIIDLEKNYPPIEYLFERDGLNCFSKGDIQVVKGKAKAGKTTFIIGIFSTAVLGHNFGFKALKPDCRCLYIDTEQNPVNTASLTKKVHSICGLSIDQNYNRFRAMNLRGDNPVDRKHFICEAFKQFQPDFVIIDGVKDLVAGGDINSPTEATETVQFLMTLTKDYNVSILTVLHENKNDENLRGHIGTELLNKCSEIWQIKKVDDLHEVEQTENRNSASKIIKYGFRFDQKGFPELVDVEPSLSKAEKNLNKKVESSYCCLQPGVRRTYKNLRQEYSVVHGCALKTAENHISELIKLDYLSKDINGLYCFNQHKLPLSI